MMLCALIVSGCNGGPAVREPAETHSATVMRPTVVINTTKGPIKVMLFPQCVEYKGEFLLDGRETHYRAFTDGVITGYYNDAAVIPKKEVLADYVWFFKASQSKDYAIEYLPGSMVQPVRGTLCVMRLDSAGKPGIFADKRSFMIVRKVVRKIGDREYYPLKGIHFPIGQVINGWEVLDKLDGKDRITGIEKGAPTPVKTSKLEMLEKEEIDNFGAVLEE